MSKIRDQQNKDHKSQFDEQKDKDPIQMFSWFTTDKLDRKVYWLFLLFLLIFYVLSNISAFFR